MTFDHKFSSHIGIGSQLLINNFFSQPGFETFFTTFVHNKFLFPPLKGYFELLYDEARLKPESLNTRSCSQSNIFHFKCSTREDVNFTMFQEQF